MIRTITPAATPVAWDPDALYSKAVRYVERLQELDSDDWCYALWSSLSLEFLARAALANVTPALLADTSKGWSSLFSSLGFTPIDEKFSPKSIVISEVFRRLSAILPAFAKELENFGIQQTGRRNAELHSGEPAFEGIKNSSRQPNFYRTCQILLASMEMTLEDFFGLQEANVAGQVMEAAADEGAKAVRGDVAAHKETWLAKQEADRDILRAQAAVWASRQVGHRVVCPACESVALVAGKAVAGPIQRLEGDSIVETQEHLPSWFECIACTLRITGLSRLTVVGLADRYKRTQVYDAAEYYAPDDRYNGYEDDNNEY